MYLKSGDSAFAKKGSIITHNNIHENFCELLVFVPDNFIKTVAQKYQVSLPESGSDHADTVIRLLRMSFGYLFPISTHAFSPDDTSRKFFAKAEVRRASFKYSFQ